MDKLKKRQEKERCWRKRDGKIIKIERKREGEMMEKEEQINAGERQRSEPRKTEKE